MSSNTSLTIPDALYERVQRIAENQQRDATAVVTEILEQGLPLVESSLPPPERKREIEAFHRLHPTLLEKFTGEYVAVFEEEVVDHDVDLAALLQRIDKRFPNDFVLIRPVRQDPEIVYEHRAVRWM